MDVDPEGDETVLCDDKVGYNSLTFFETLYVLTLMHLENAFQIVNKRKTTTFFVFDNFRDLSWELKNKVQTRTLNGFMKSEL